MLSKNKAIRLEINLMLQLRMIYYETLIAIRKQSHACRNKMGEIVEMSTVAYDSRCAINYCILKGWNFVKT